MIVLIGKSGAGKSTIQKLLVERHHFKKVVQYTDRPMREGEVDGIDYHFLTPEQYDNLLATNECGEWSSYPIKETNGRYRYCSLKKDYEKYSVLATNPSNIEDLTKILDSKNMMIAELVCNDDIRFQRLHKRGDSIQRINNREEQDNIDFSDFRTFYLDSSCSGYTHIMVNTSQDTSHAEYEIHDCYDHFIEQKITIDYPTFNSYEKVIYISHNFGGDPENLKKIHDFIEVARKKYPNYLFLSPVDSFGFLYNDCSYSEGLNMCLFLLKQCDECWVVYERDHMSNEEFYKFSTGVNFEMAYCKKQKIPICYACQVHFCQVHFED